MDKSAPAANKPAGSVKASPAGGKGESGSSQVSGKDPKIDPSL